MIWRGDLLLPFERRLRPPLRPTRTSARGAGIAGIRSSPFVSSRYLHELHRVLLLFFRLLEKQLREQRQLPLLEVRRDADVLHAGAEFVADLFVEGFHKFRTNQHEHSPRRCHRR